MVGIEVPGILLLIIGGLILCGIAGAIVWLIESLGRHIDPDIVLPPQDEDFYRLGENKNPNTDEKESS